MMRYDVLHDYAQRNKLDYNELCRVMREATATPLTDDQIDTIYVSKLAGKGFDNIAVAFRAMVRAVEKAHGIGGAALPMKESDDAQR